MINEQKIRRLYTHALTPNTGRIQVLRWDMLFLNNFNRQSWEPNLWISQATLEIYPGQLPVFAPSEKNTDDSLYDDWMYQKNLTAKTGLDIRFYEQIQFTENNQIQLQDRLFGQQKFLNYGKIYTVDLLPFFFRHRAYYSDRRILVELDYPIEETYDSARNVFILCIMIEGSVSWEDQTQQIELV